MIARILAVAAMLVGCLGTIESTVFESIGETASTPPSASADSGNHRIRGLRPDGTIETFSVGLP